MQTTAMRNTLKLIAMALSSDVDAEGTDHERAWRNEALSEIGAESVAA
jgi:hypothetical protein